MDAHAERTRLKSAWMGGLHRLHRGRHARRGLQEPPREGRERLRPQAPELGPVVRVAEEVVAMGIAKRNNIPGEDGYSGTRMTIEARGPGLLD